jgi:hypothetical protein
MNGMAMLVLFLSMWAGFAIVWRKKSAVIKYVGSLVVTLGIFATVAKLTTPELPHDVLDERLSMTEEEQIKSYSNRMQAKRLFGSEKSENQTDDETMRLYELYNRK